MALIMNKVAVILCLSVFVVQLNASAIPMWEYLSKDEKRSFLYSMFANQVDEFCSTNSIVKNCNQDLLKYGLGKLKEMPEDHLDSMDPYQRGASNIIWESIMEGHEMAKTTPRTPQIKKTSSPKPNSYEDESFGDDFVDGDFGAQSAASAKIDNVYRVPPPKGFLSAPNSANVLEYKSGKPIYTYPHNVVPYLNMVNKINNKGKQEDQQTSADYNKDLVKPDSSTNENVKNVENSFDDYLPLTGPMVVRVYPDGTPVREFTETPQDEDLRQYKLSKILLPSL